MTQRQWLNIIIISLAFSTLLFLFAHQRLTRNIPSTNQWDAEIKSDKSSTLQVIESSSPIVLVQFGQKKYRAESVRQQWNEIQLEPYQADLNSPALQHSIKVIFEDQQQLFSIVLDQQKYFLLRHHDQQLFKLPHQTYVVLVPATYNPN
jgi:hypothetical protein